MDLLDSYPWALALAIFLARVIDVSLGTVRTILVFRSRRLLAATIGFFEVLLWLAAAGQVLQNLDAWYLAVAYAGGFAVGNAVGIWLEAKLAIGWELVRAISHEPAVQLARSLRAAGHSVTELRGTGDTGDQVEVLLIAEPRRRTPGLLRLIAETDPGAVWTISDVRQPHGPPSPRHSKPFDLLARVKRK